MFGKKKYNKELLEKANKCKDIINAYVTNCSDNQVLNALFTKITIFRMKYDRKDFFIKNILDWMKRKKNIEVKALIVNQLDDILDESIFEYDETQIKELEQFMVDILPSEEKTKTNGFIDFITNFWDYFFKGAGVK